MMAPIERKSYKDTYKRYRTREGLVVCGTGGDLQEWVTGITKYLYDNKVVSVNDHEKIWAWIVVFDTTSANPNRTDMLFVFPENTNCIDMEKFAIVRLRMNEEITRASWWSDYIVNFKNDHR